MSSAVTQLRTVLGGRKAGPDGPYIITLDGNQEVETTEERIFKLAGTAKRDGTVLSVDIIPVPNGRGILTDADPSVKPKPTALVPQVLPAEGLSDRILHTAKEFRDEWNHPVTRMKYNILAPVTDFGALPSHLGIQAMFIKIDPDPTRGAAGDVYQDKLFTREGEVALTKNGLKKIANGFGASITTARTDNRRTAHYWEVRATVRFRGLDGSIKTVEASDEFDLRDGSAKSARMTDAQKMQARAKGLRQCEARAVNAAIRSAFTLKQVYTRHELAKPFAVPMVVVSVDMTDPVIKAMVVQDALRGIDTVYGPPQIEEADIPDADETHAAPDLDPDVEQERFEQEVKAVQPPPVDPKPVSDVPPIGSTRVVGLAKEPGNNPKSGPWMLYKVTFESGAKADTFDRALHTIIDEALTTQAFVKITTETNRNPQYADKLLTIEIVDSRQGALPIGDESY